MTRPPGSVDSDSTSPEISGEMASVVQLLHTLMQIPPQQDLFHREERPTTRMVYTSAVTIWLLILQRLNGGLSLNHVLSKLVCYVRDLLPDNKRVRENTLSLNSAAYSQARTRLLLDLLLNFSQNVCNHLGEISEPLIKGRRVFVLDGTTITFAPTKELQKAYPPATNQHGTSVWPVARLMLANELQSGCAMLPQVDPMYGPNNVSEAVQAQQIVTQLPEKSIVLADSNFGIFSVAYHTRLAGHDFLFRLTKARFDALCRNAELVDKGLLHKSYRVLWKPSAKDRKSVPGLPASTVMEVILHEVQISPEVMLYLVTSLDFDGPSAAELYRRRYDIEFDIRDVKVTMDTENIRAKSVDMVLKELYASVVAYNLVAQFRRQAAKLGCLEPRRLSFTGVWNIFQHRLLAPPTWSLQEWQARYAEALYRASQAKLPNRAEPRSYERRALPRRAKSTKFEKNQRKKSTPAQDANPPPIGPK